MTIFGFSNINTDLFHFYLFEYVKAIDRLYQYLDSIKVKPTNFEKELGLSNGYLSSQKKRGADMGESIIVKITDYCRELSLEWLLTGRGEMLRQNNSEVAKSQKVEPTIIYRDNPDKDEIIQLLRDKVKLLEQNASQPPPQLGFYAPRPPLEKPAAVNPAPITPEPKRSPKSEINR